MFSSPAAGAYASGPVLSLIRLAELLHCPLFNAHCSMLNDGGPFYGELAPSLLPNMGNCSIKKQMLDMFLGMDDYLLIKIIFAQSCSRQPAPPARTQAFDDATREERAGGP
ncbi:hypothetical protein [Herbaspirillum seropedicae]|uniref:hypothetical protein n=1 Tax=Herbaspirillum seropedicae TaxID=964 RepID=UPI003D96E329